MKYLPCESCGHANALKSEYLTFCDACGRKLPNNFAEWRKRYPLGSYPEYRQAVGIFIKKEKPGRTAAWMKKQFQPGNRGKVILFFSLVFALMVTAGTLFGKRAVFTLLYAKVPKSSLYSNWQTATIGRQALEISTPVKLWVHDQPLGTEGAKTIEYAKSYRNQDGDGIQIAVNMFSYWNNVANGLEGAVEESHYALQAGGQITDMRCKSVRVLISGMPGILEDGSYLYKGAIRLAFCNLVMVRGNSRWLVHINYRNDDPVGRQVAQRVLKSIKIR
ncbi:hypothetical protein [Chitinophaga sp. MM2321]|uniref:hypothetical protein n=1 Tax=Chitinophaga sp. MM2321 TaxID=3137178 RepID=UPI0032D56AC8